MASIGSDGFWDLTDALNPSAKKETRLVSAVVTKVDDEGVAWVHIPSAEDETPINGILTAEVKPGDQVQVEIENGRANLVGNATSPAVGQEQVTRTVAPVAEKAETAATQASEASSTADAARAIAEATGQYFWHDDGGAHISTEANNPDGAQNSVWNSLGMLFRQGVANLLALLPTEGKIAMFDGTNSNNVIAEFTPSEVSLAKGVSLEDGAEGAVTFFDGLHEISANVGNITDGSGNKIGVGLSGFNVDQLEASYGTATTKQSGGTWSEVRWYEKKPGSPSDQYAISKAKLCAAAEVAKGSRSWFSEGLVEISSMLDSRGNAYAGLRILADDLQLATAGDSRSLTAKMSRLIDVLMDTRWITLDSTSGTVQIRASGGFCTVRVSGCDVTTNWTTIATIPEEFRPADTMGAAGYSGGAGRNHMALIAQANGAVRVSAPTAATGNGSGTLTYPIG